MSPCSTVRRPVENFNILDLLLSLGRFNIPASAIRQLENIEVGRFRSSLVGKAVILHGKRILKLRTEFRRSLSAS
jgi:hypothetical protein